MLHAHSGYTATPYFTPLTKSCVSRMRWCELSHKLQLFNSAIHFSMNKKEEKCFLQASLLLPILFSMEDTFLRFLSKVSNISQRGQSTNFSGLRSQTEYYSKKQVVVTSQLLSVRYSSDHKSLLSTVSTNQKQQTNVSWREKKNIY